MRQGCGSHGLPHHYDLAVRFGRYLQSTAFEGKYDGAIPELRKALNQRPTSWKILALLGIAEKRTGDIEHVRAAAKILFLVRSGTDRAAAESFRIADTVLAVTPARSATDFNVGID